MVASECYITCEPGSVLPGCSLHSYLPRPKSPGEWKWSKTAPPVTPGNSSSGDGGASWFLRLTLSPRSHSFDPNNRPRKLFAQGLSAIRTVEGKCLRSRRPDVGFVTVDSKQSPTLTAGPLHHDDRGFLGGHAMARFRRKVYPRRGTGQRHRDVVAPCCQIPQGACSRSNGAPQCGGSCASSCASAHRHPVLAVAPTCSAALQGCASRAGTQTACRRPYSG